MASSESTVPEPIVLITGANRVNGIGFALARSLGCNHGYYILLGCRNKESGVSAATKLEELGVKIDVVRLDLTDDSSLAGAAEYVRRRYGRIDILVNNAAILLDQRFYGGLRELLATTFDTNVSGTAMVTKTFAPLLESSLHLPARIVFLSSVLGSIQGRSNPHHVYDGVDLMAYRVSKAGLNMLCAAYSRKFSAAGWKVNAVCPGYVATDFNTGAGTLSAEEAVPVVVRLCTLGVDGESGTFTDSGGELSW